VLTPLWIGLRTTAVTLVVTGVLYPLALTGLAQLAFPTQANGSLVADEHGAIVGSALIAQGFAGAAYFQPRPSAAGAGYDGAASSGSNLGTTSAKLRQRVESDLARLKAENPDAVGLVPVELLTTSASGLDPHLSPAGAEWQIPRIATARGVTPARVRALVESQVVGRDLWILGEPRVNVLAMNLALDRQFGRP
jgi:K+-transporting ATPase ATPase C chain